MWSLGFINSPPQSASREPESRNLMLTYLIITIWNESHHSVQFQGIKPMHQVNLIHTQVELDIKNWCLSTSQAERETDKRLPRPTSWKQYPKLDTVLTMYSTLPDPEMWSLEYLSYPNHHYIQNIPRCKAEVYGCVYQRRNGWENNKRGNLQVDMQVSVASLFLTPILSGLTVCP